MSKEQEPPTPRAGSVVVTACKGFVHYERSTPSVVYRGKRIFFCLHTCLRSFEEDPKTSCLIGDSLLDEA